MYTIEQLKKLVIDNEAVVLIESESQWTKLNELKMFNLCKYNGHYTYDLKNGSYSFAYQEVLGKIINHDGRKVIKFGEIKFDSKYTLDQLKNGEFIVYIKNNDEYDKLVDTNRFRMFSKYQGNGYYHLNSQRYTYNLVNNYTDETVIDFKGINFDDDETFHIRVDDMEKIYRAACSSWKEKIIKLTNQYRFSPFSDEVDLPKSVVKEMFDAATTHNGVDQKEVLKKIFPNFTESRFKPFQLVWAWDNNSTYKYVRAIRVWDAENDQVFDTKYDNYETYTGPIEPFMVEMVEACRNKKP